MQAAETANNVGATTAAIVARVAQAGTITAGMPVVVDRGIDESLAYAGWAVERRSGLVDMLVVLPLGRKNAPENHRLVCLDQARRATKREIEGYRMKAMPSPARQPQGVTP